MMIYGWKRGHRRMNMKRWCHSLRTFMCHVTCLATGFRYNMKLGGAGASWKYFYSVHSRLCSSNKYPDNYDSINGRRYAHVFCQVKRPVCRTNAAMRISIFIVK